MLQMGFSPNQSLLLDFFAVGALLLLIDTFVFQVLLFGGHLGHGSTVFGLLVDLLHVVHWSHHVLLAHHLHRCLAVATSPLLSLPFALLATALVQGRIQL